MIVEPTPTNPRSPVRRALRLAGLVLPVVLLAGVVAAGLLGPRPADLPPLDSDPPLEAAASNPMAAADASSSPTPVPAPSGPGPGFPAVAADLSVLSIVEAQGAMAHSPGRPIAVAGYLDRVRTADGCPASAGDARGLLSPLCERSALLVVASGDAANTGAHLHLRILPGVRLPAAFEDAVADAPMRVVVVGRGDRTGALCGNPERGCANRLTADLVAWADGSPFDPGPVFESGPEALPPAIAHRYLDHARSLVVGPSGTVLMSALVRPRTVAAIDPDAGAALAAGPTPRGLVWYVRGLATTYGPGRFPVGDYPPRMLWVVLDGTTGEPLATGLLTPSDDVAASDARG